MHGNIPDAVDHALRSPRSLAPLVLVMGFLGATARYALEMLLPAQCGFPVATLAVNIFGCFTLGMFALYLGITVLATFGAAYAGKRLADAMGPRYSAHHRAAAPQANSHQNEDGAQ